MRFTVYPEDSTGRTAGNLRERKPRKESSRLNLSLRTQNNNALANSQGNKKDETLA